MSNKRWQAPGNGKIFDSSLENIKGHTMSERTVGILNYIFENNNAINISVFEKEIWGYLIKQYNHKHNNSMIQHFYRPLLFYGLLRNIDNTLSLSIDGKMFLNHVNNKQYYHAMKCFINQIVKTSYPNKATKFVGVALYPFKIFFRLLLEQNLSTEFIQKKLIYIENIEDYNSLNKEGELYDKYQTWIIHSFVDLGLIDCTNEMYFINNTYKDYIYSLLYDEPISTFFIDDINYLYTKGITRHQNNRNPNIRRKTLERDSYQCTLDNNHTTFISRFNGKQYVESHHIIPMARQDTYTPQNIDLDCLENTISLCPCCHRKIHYAIDEEKIKIIDWLIANKKISSKFKIKKDDLIEIYI